VRGLDIQKLELTRWLAKPMVSYQSARPAPAFCANPEDTGMANLTSHWNTAYTARAEDALTWFEATPAQSLRLVRQYLPQGGALVDVGAGASRLIDHVLADGAGAVTVLDLSDTALNITRARLGDAAKRVSFIATDIRDWHPDRSYDVWHDRAVFHFLTDREDQARYLATLSKALAADGIAIIATFDLTGPETCSGLPVQRYSPQTLVAKLAELAPGQFVPLASEHVEHRTPKGNFQAFQVSVFRKLA
jgi:SAM-dependent methyltransferase